MKYLNNWNSFKLNENKNIKQSISFNKVDLSKIVDKINNQYTDLKIKLYPITEDDNEKRINVVVDSINFNPLSDKYKKSLMNNDRTVKYNFDDMYTDDFKKLIKKIEDIVSDFDLKYNNVILTNRLKNELI